MAQVVIANHVNTLVRTAFNEQTVVDFNIRDYEGPQKSRKVDDDYALALYYTNVGAEALLRNDYPVSAAHFRAAAGVYPGMAGLWVNLGVLYARQGLLEQAESAYLYALEVDAYAASALANLAVVYRDLGEAELAAEYHARVQKYRERNPYYHFAVATLAYEQGRLPDALAALRKALRLKHDESQFHSLRGQVQQDMAAAATPRRASCVRASTWKRRMRGRASGSRLTRSRCAKQRFSSFVVGLGLQSEQKRRAASGLALDPDSATVPIDDPRRDRETQTQAAASRISLPISQRLE